MYFQSKAIVVSTLNHAANKAISQQFFATATILDEAGLVMHAEWLVFALRRPRTDYGGRPVVASFGLVGDPNQLRPNISRQNALSELETNKRGLNYSPIEVLANLGVCAQALEVSVQGIFRVCMDKRAGNKQTAWSQLPNGLSYQTANYRRR